MSLTRSINCKDIYRKNGEDVKGYLKKESIAKKMDMLPFNG
jgi:hypothetical protein